MSRARNLIPIPNNRNPALLGSRDSARFQETASAGDKCLLSRARTKPECRSRLAIVSLSPLSDVMPEHPQLWHEQRKRANQPIREDARGNLGPGGPESIAEDLCNLRHPEKVTSAQKALVRGSWGR